MFFSNSLTKFTECEISLFYSKKINELYYLRVRMKKFQAIISFNMDEEFMTFVPPHRTYINFLLNKGVIETYSVSMESQQSWITINAYSKTEVKDILQKSPLFKYWDCEIVELFVYDSQSNRLPAVQLN